MNLMWILSGTIFSLTTLSVAFGAVPSKSRLTDDTAIYQSLSEIKVAKSKAPDFDHDIERLSQSESNYKEKLPALDKHSRLIRPMERVASQKYRFSGRNSKL